jgi:hypothetical protein
MAKKPVNDRLVDRAVMHAHFVQRYKANEVKLIKQFMEDEIFPDIIGRIDKLAKWGIDPEKEVAMKKLLKDLINDGMGTMSVDFSARMIKFSKEEANFAIKQLNDLTPIGVDFKTPNFKTLRAVVTEQPFEGDILKNWYSNQSRKIQDDIFREVRKGVALGEDVPTITARLKGTSGFPGTLKKSVRNAEAVARTAINHVSNAARQASYKENEKFLKGYQYIATLDSKTTDICMAASQDDSAGLGPGGYKLGEGPEPPLHFNCRSTTVPIVKSFKELGLDIKEIPEGTRASLKGQVPERQTYNEWLNKQSQAIRVKTLGKTRARLFTEGKITTEDLVNSRFRSLRLEEIYERQNLTFAEVKDF